MGKENMTTWKRIAIRSLFFGAGFALIAAAISAGIAWYLNRPQPWDTQAITSEYSHVHTRGESHTLVFYYTLINNTNKDYSFPGYSELPIFFQKLKIKMH